MRRRLGALVAAAALVLILALVPQPPAGAAGAPVCAGQDAGTSRVKGLKAGSHPVVLVHGWTGKPLTDTEEALKKPLGDGWKIFQFGYHDYSNQWAAVPPIAACLAAYVADLSAAHRAVHGDGMVYLVGHSMGGLAARFAADPAWGGTPVIDKFGQHHSIADLVGGVVTLDTPHGGSPWGNTQYGRAMEAWGRFNPWAAGQHDASRCLALHQGAVGMLAGCAVPPYLANKIPITQVAGVLTVDRTLFGHHLYDISMGGDTIVPLDSEAGYIGSGAQGKSATLGGRIHIESVACTVTSDRLFGFAATLGATVVSPRLGMALARLDSDSAAMDALGTGSADPALLQFLAVAGLVGDCAHGNITHNESAIAVTAAALKADAKAGDAPTVGFDHWGLVKLGMTPSQAAGVLGAKVASHGVSGTDGCFQPQLAQPFGDVTFLVEGITWDGPITRFDVGYLESSPSPAGSPRTDAGVAIGDSEAQVKATYPGRVQVSAHVYVPGGHYLEVLAGQGDPTGTAIVFETDASRRVTSIRSGYRQQAEYIEGCS